MPGSLGVVAIERLLAQRRVDRLQRGASLRAKSLKLPVEPADLVFCAGSLHELAGFAPHGHQRGHLVGVELAGSARRDAERADLAAVRAQRHAGGAGESRHGLIAALARTQQRLAARDDLVGGVVDGEGLEPRADLVRQAALADQACDGVVVEQNDDAGLQRESVERDVQYLLKAALEGRRVADGRDDAHEQREALVAWSH